MSAAISSAQPFKLYRYSDVTTGIDQDIASESSWLGDLLRNFEARCTEYPVRVSYLADSLRDHARTAEGIDRWVYSVGQGFERADRGYAATWGLRGQGVFSAQAAAFIDRLAVSGALAQRWSLALQIFKTKWALNEAILRLRYQVFMLKYAPWFDLARLPWDLYEKYQSLLAGTLIASSIRFGHSYPGQIIINLPDFLRNFGFSLREIRTWAGLSGHLTHIKYTNLPSHMFWASLALSIPSLVSKWSSDIIDYGSGEYTGTELASALTVDTALTLAPVITTYAGAKVGMIFGAKLGALIGTAVAPGVGTAIGGAVGAIVGGVIAGWATKKVIERTDIREKAIPWLDEHVFGPRGAIASGANAVSGWVDEAGSRLRQKLQDTADAANRVIHDKAIKPTTGEALELRQSLHDAMDGWGTDEDAIFSLLTNATDAEKQAILNDPDLMARLQHELDRNDFKQVLTSLSPTTPVTPQLPIVPRSRESTSDAPGETEVPTGLTEKIESLIVELYVETNDRYRPREGKTWCNIYVMDIAKNLGIPLFGEAAKFGSPEAVDWNNDGKIDDYLDANKTVSWLLGAYQSNIPVSNQGPDSGWQTISSVEAARLATEGYFVIAGWYNPGGIGHMAVVRPNSTPEDIRIAQAGSENFSDGSITRPSWPLDEVKYFVYRFPLPVNDQQQA